MTAPADQDGATTGSSPTSRGGVVAWVDPDSPAERAGIVTGSRILTADGMALRDVVDWRWYADGPCVAVRWRDAKGTESETVLVREPGESWGVEFKDLVFDRVRTCRNRCAFCFVSQLPSGLRRTLYVRDDDFRLSFLQGNFITLTNLNDEDVERIAEQHLSPLYVSLHAVESDVRSRLLCASEDRALERFDQLVEEGIDLHVQIVLVPGENDGQKLHRTLTWLATREGVRSVGVVPLGYTDHQKQFTRSYEYWRDAKIVLNQLEPWRQAFRARDGISWVHAADEFYLNARSPVPGAGTYDGFPQLENGIGLVRTFLDDFAALSERLVEVAERIRRDATRAGCQPGRVHVVSGAMFASLLEDVLRDAELGDVVRVLPVENRFFGGNTSVTGLLTAEDVIPAVRQTCSEGVVLMPDVIMNAEGLTLDDVPALDLGPLTGTCMRLVSSDAAGLLDGLEWAAGQAIATSPKR